MKTHTFKIFALKGLQGTSLDKEENALIMSADGNGRGTKASSSVRQKLKKCILSCNEKRALAKEIRRAMKTYRASGQTTWISGSAVTGLQEKRRQPISVSGNAHFRNLCERFQMQRRYSWFMWWSRRKDHRECHLRCTKWSRPCLRIVSHFHWKSAFFKELRYTWQELEEITWPSGRGHTRAASHTKFIKPTVSLRNSMA